MKANPRAPGNAQAAFARIRPYLQSLGESPIPEEIEVLTNRLPPSAPAVIEGWRSGSANHWVDVAVLDRKLALSNTDSWYLESVLLRA